jgi:hypothetical protein
LEKLLEAMVNESGAGMDEREERESGRRREGSLVGLL